MTVEGTQVDQYTRLVDCGNDVLVPFVELVDGRYVPDFGEEGALDLLDEWYRFNPDDHEGAVGWIRNLAAGGEVWGFLYELNGQPFTEDDLLELYERLKRTAREGCFAYREGGGELKESLGRLSQFSEGWSAHGRFAAEALALGAWWLAGSMAESWYQTANEIENGTYHSIHGTNAA